MHPLGAELGKADLTALTIFALTVWMTGVLAALHKASKPQRSSPQPCPPGSTSMAMRLLSSRHKAQRSAVHSRSAFAGSRCEDTQPNYQIKFTSSWHTKHPLDTAANTVISHPTLLSPPASWELQLLGQLSGHCDYAVYHSTIAEG